MKNMDDLEDRFVIETLGCREKLLKDFSGNAHVYFLDAMVRDRAQIAAGRTRTGKTKDVTNPGQGKTPMRDPLMEEVYAAKEKVSRSMRLTKKESAA